MKATRVCSRLFWNTSIAQWIVIFWNNGNNRWNFQHTTIFKIWLDVNCVYGAKSEFVLYINPIHLHSNTVRLINYYISFRLVQYQKVETLCDACTTPSYRDIAYYCFYSSLHSQPNTVNCVLGSADGEGGKEFNQRQEMGVDCTLAQKTLICDQL